MKKPCVYLVPFREDHLEQTFHWIKDENLRDRFKFGRDITWEDHVQWFGRLGRNDSVKLFGIHCGETDHYVGNCGLKHLDAEKKCSETWIYIGEKDCYGKGYGTAAVALLLQYAFEALKLEFVYLYVSGDNHAARRIYEKNGFVEKALPEENEWTHRGVPDVRYMERKNGRNGK